MLRVLFIFVLSITPYAVTAQDAPKRVKTETIRTTAPGLETLYAIDPDGTVRIDWDAVETLSVSKADRNMLPIAQLMLAIRDRTWKPVR
jgi:hypothetical protein